MLMEDDDKRLQTIQRHFWKKFIKGRGYKEQKASTMKLLYTDRPSRETARQTLPLCPCPCLSVFALGHMVSTYRQASKQTSRQAGRQTDRQTDRQTKRERVRDYFPPCPCFCICLRHCPLTHHMNNKSGEEERE